MNNKIKYLEDVKQKRDACYSKLSKLKTMPAKQKQWDTLCELQRDLITNIQPVLDTITLAEAKQLNIMAMMGGPYCTVKAIEISIFLNHVTLTFDGKKYAGTVTFMEDVCGIDNLEILINILKNRGV